MDRAGVLKLFESNGFCKGYSEMELKKIEKLYDVCIGGDLRCYMMLAGRCAGYLLGDGFSLMYAPVMSVRDHLLYQEGRRHILSESVGLHGIVMEKPFFFSESFDTYSFFIKTKPKNYSDENKVYCLDENEDVVIEEDLPFIDFILDRIEKRKGDSLRRDVLCVGEMIEITA